MGAFTTFSTFISETSQLLSDQELLLGFANVSFQVIVGIGAFYLGLFIVRAI
jgi:CrcB protein